MALTSLDALHLASRSLQLSAMAHFFPASANPDTAFKHMQRLIKEVMLPADKIAPLMFAILGFKENEKMALILDRTSWQFGGAHLNFLFLGSGYSDK